MADGGSGGKQNHATEKEERKFGVHAESVR